jgi:hypothetical protein
MIVTFRYPRYQTDPVVESCQPVPYVGDGNRQMRRPSDQQQGQMKVTGVMKFSGDLQYSRTHGIGWLADKRFVGSAGGDFEL